MHDSLSWEVNRHTIVTHPYIRDVISKQERDTKRRSEPSYITGPFFQEWLLIIIVIIIIIIIFIIQHLKRSATDRRNWIRHSAYPLRGLTYWPAAQRPMRLSHLARITASDQKQHIATAAAAAELNNGLVGAAIEPALVSIDTHAY